MSRIATPRAPPGPRCSRGFSALAPTSTPLRRARRESGRAGSVISQRASGDLLLVASDSVSTVALADGVLMPQLTDEASAARRSIGRTNQSCARHRFQTRQSGVLWSPSSRAPRRLPAIIFGTYPDPGTLIASAGESMRTTAPSIRISPERAGKPGRSSPPAHCARSRRGRRGPRISRALDRQGDVSALLTRGSSTRHQFERALASWQRVPIATSDTSASPRARPSSRSIRRGRPSAIWRVAIAAPSPQHRDPIRRSRTLRRDDGRCR